MVQLAIKNCIVFLIKISSFFLFHNYELDIIQIEQNLKIKFRKNPDLKFSKFWTDVIMSKMKDAMKFAQTVMINAQQKQKH